ncbi:DUF3667 domain-containing protein [Kordiimonas sp.]|uniref:DUF3667 domain-containing protein n=1 Tax=Kordiimonas sp. TaxID=1970157 RepID=UPI003A9219B5
MEQAQGKSSATCCNCGAGLDGLYCSRCGQKHRGHTLDASELVGEALDSVVKVDSRLWRTIIELTKNPGRLARDYAAGQRIRYVNPLRYCFAAIALSIALTLSTGEFALLSTSVLPGSAMVAPNDPALAQLTAFMAKYLNVMTLLSVPVYALILRILFHRSGYGYAANFVFVCFIVGHAALLSCVATLFNSYVYFLGIVPALLITNFVYIYGAMRFYERGFWLAASYVSIASVLYFALVFAVAWASLDFWMPT